LANATRTIELPDELIARHHAAQRDLEEANNEIGRLLHIAGYKT